MKTQVKDLEAEQVNKPAVMGMGGKKHMGGKNQSVDHTSNKANEDLINFLEQKIDEFEKKLDKT